MKNQGQDNFNARQNEGALLGEITDAKASGFSYTFGVVFYLILSFLFLFVAQGMKESVSLYMQYMLSPIAIVCLTVWYFVWTKKSFARAVKKQKCSIKYYFIAIFLQIGLLSLSELNNLFIVWLQKFGYKPLPMTLPSMDGFGIVGVLLVIVVLPAIFEEIFFRGLLLDGCKVFGEIGAALVCGALFALYHQNPAQTVYQFCCGAAFALVAIKAGSILPTVLSHFLNNAAVILLTKFGLDSFTKPVFITILCVSIPCLIFSLAYLIFFDKKKQNEVKTGTQKQFFLGALVGIIICGAVWISALFTGV
jgi:membrane protease YdiL (CAAX protease family)